MPHARRAIEGSCSKREGVAAGLAFPLALLARTAAAAPRGDKRAIYNNYHTYKAVRKGQDLQKKLNQGLGQLEYMFAWKECIDGSTPSPGSVDCFIEKQNRLIEDRPWLIYSKSSNFIFNHYNQ